MNRLSNSRCYLCGAMDRTPDMGVTWRQDTRYQLAYVGAHWLDPTRKPIDVGVEDAPSRARRALNKSIGNYDAVVKEMNPIRRVDLRMVDISDWLIVNLDLDIHACGTYEEIFLANRQKKPVLVHIEQGKKSAPDWLFGTLPHEHLFSTWGALYDYIDTVACDEHFIDTDGRWYFFDWMGK